MIRHVTKCKQKMYNAGFERAHISPSVGIPLTVQSRVPHTLSEDVRRQRRNAFKERASSTIGILKDESRQAVAEIFLASGL